MDVGPPEGWTAEDATQRLLELAHNYPEHHKKREEWRKEAEDNKKRGLDVPPKICEWCEKNGKPIRLDGWEEREKTLLAVDDDEDDGDS